MDLTSKHIAVLRVLAGRDDWMTSGEVHAAGGGGSAAGAGVLMQRLRRAGLVDRQAILHEPTMWRLTVHGQRVLEEQMAHPPYQLAVGDQTGRAGFQKRQQTSKS